MRRRVLLALTDRRLSLFDALCLGGVVGLATEAGNPWLYLLVVPLMLVSVALESYARVR